MSDVGNYSKQFLTEFIEMYKSFPCLWKIKLKEYSDRNKKNVAYQKKAEKLKEVEPEAYRDFVTKKINSLRISYRKEKKKIRDSLKSGAGADNVHVPNLWYFHLLKFVDDQEAARQPISNFDQELSQDEDNTDVESINSPPEHRPVSQCSTNNASEVDVLSPTPTSSNIPLPPKRLNKKREIEIDCVITSVGKKLIEAQPEDTHDAFGRNVAHKLRNLPNNQRIYLEKLINEKLSRNCYIYVPSISTQTSDVSDNSVHLSTSTYTSSRNTTNLSGEISFPTTSSERSVVHQDNNPQITNLDNIQNSISHFVTNYVPYSQ